MATYRLINPNKHKSVFTIDSSAKETFKEMMNWTEEEWLKHTVQVEEEK